MNVQETSRDVIWWQDLAKAYNTWDSQAVSDPSTNQAQRCLTCQIGRDGVCSTWYGRKRKGGLAVGIKDRGEKKGENEERRESAVKEELMCSEIAVLEKSVQQWKRVVFHCGECQYFNHTFPYFDALSFHVMNNIIFPRRCI